MGERRAITHMDVCLFFTHVIRRTVAQGLSDRIPASRSILRFSSGVKRERSRETKEGETKMQEVNNDENKNKYKIYISS